jgi:hypothetical protein
VITCAYVRQAYCTAVCTMKVYCIWTAFCFNIFFARFPESKRISLYWSLVFCSGEISACQLGGEYWDIIYVNFTLRNIILDKITKVTFSNTSVSFNLQWIGVKKPYVEKSKLFAYTPYRDADKSLAWPTSRCILFDGENISFDASLVIYIYIYIYRYIYSTHIPPIMILNRIYETQNLLSL